MDAHLAGVGSRLNVLLFGGCRLDTESHLGELIQTEFRDVSSRLNRVSAYPVVNDGGDDRLGGGRICEHIGWRPRSRVCEFMKKQGCERCDHLVRVACAAVWPSQAERHPVFDVAPRHAKCEPIVCLRAPRPIVQVCALLWRKPQKDCTEIELAKKKKPAVVVIGDHNGGRGSEQLQGLARHALQGKAEIVAHPRFGNEHTRHDVVDFGIIGLLTDQRKVGK
jgi:hypothetical protein